MTNEKEGRHGHEADTLPLTINNVSLKWHQQYITGAEIRKLGKIPPDEEVFLGIKRPWEDELVLDDSRIDLARPGVEHFYSKKKHEQHLVTIHVNNVKRRISRGLHTVAEIKSVGEVPAEHELDELIDGKLTPLKDDGNVLIKGGEEFFSHVRDGSSS